MKSFNELGIEANIVKAIEELGFTEPMPVQEEVIPHLLNDRTKDIIALAQTGTGKTAAFGIPLIQNSKGKPKYVTHLILKSNQRIMSSNS